MSGQALRVLPQQMPGVNEEQKRHVLSSTRAELCSGQSSLVFCAAAQQVQHGEDAGQVADGAGGAGAHVGRPSILAGQHLHFLPKVKPTQKSI